MKRTKRYVNLSAARIIRKGIIRMNPKKISILLAVTKT